jgi:hypothetical protein
LWAVVIIFTLATSCRGVARPTPTVAPPVSAAALSVHVFATNTGDAEERSRLPGLRDAIAGALPDAWAMATGGRGKLSIRTDADIDVELNGSAGTSALTQHSRDGKIASRSIVVHTVDGRHLSTPEIMATTLHELGHLWCCYGPGTADGHWSDPPPTRLAPGLMFSPIRCQVIAGGEPACPTVFSERETQTMGLTRAP